MSDSFETLWTVALQTQLSTGFPKQGYWSGLPFPSPGDLPKPRIEPASPALAGRFFTPEPAGKLWVGGYPSPFLAPESSSLGLPCLPSYPLILLRPSTAHRPTCLAPVTWLRLRHHYVPGASFSTFDPGQDLRISPRVFPNTCNRCAHKLPGPRGGEQARKGQCFPKSITHLICKVTSHICAQVNFLGAYFRTGGRSGILSVSFTEKAGRPVDVPWVSDSFTQTRADGERWIFEGPVSSLHGPSGCLDRYHLTSSQESPYQMRMRGSSSHRCGNWSQRRSGVFVSLTDHVTWAESEFEPRFQTPNSTFSPPPSAVRDGAGVIRVTYYFLECSCTYPSGYTSKSLYWSIVNLQYCVSFRCTAK